MIHHHPDNNLLLEYASGSLNWAHSLVVSAHLQLCPKCSAQMKLLNGIGGSLLATSVPVKTPPAASDQEFSRLMHRIDEHTDECDSEEQDGESTANRDGSTAPSAYKPTHVGSSDPLFSDLPKVVAKLVKRNPALKWRRLSKGLKEAYLKTGQSQHQVSFHRISPGNKVAEHGHRGKEITMVLYGSFSDADGVYSRGDFLVREPGEVHRPTATQDQECLCLSVVEAPVALTGVLGKLVNPFLSIKPQ
ncbi:ChrR family anti-sigma-E factor [Microbulbifer sp. CAU 1566]|uniref:ChrR family anti-sigma-E factor n=1 Tax=Microbulbifer sp. CAU 1566 TaxID=2933269 RepID=UPI0020037BC4|nr:ChrR family anti-sigma-E factor [Microbulbifer sp. CAU 1566]MCK7597029.1 ChrR family anti-sigma-E factor [Microbulbifer sp. CAU 1566]